MFTTEYVKFKRMAPPYNSCYYVKKGRRASVPSMDETSECSVNMGYGTKLKELKGDQAEVKLICKYGIEFAKIVTRIEVVENANSLIKLIHRAQRASLGHGRLCDLIYVVGNKMLLKKHGINLE